MVLGILVVATMLSAGQKPKLVKATFMTRCTRFLREVVLLFVVSMKGGESVQVIAVTLVGARPNLVVEDSDGTTVIETDASEQIDEEFTIHNAGRYYVMLENTALVNSGQWDVDIYVEYEIEREVCE